MFLYNVETESMQFSSLHIRLNTCTLFVYFSVYCPGHTRVLFPKKKHVSSISTQHSGALFTFSVKKMLYHIVQLIPDTGIRFNMEQIFPPFPHYWHLIFTEHIFPGTSILLWSSFHKLFSIWLVLTRHHTVRPNKVWNMTWSCALLFFPEDCSCFSETAFFWGKQHSIQR